MLAPAFDIVNLEAGFFETGHRAADIVELAAGENIFGQGGEFRAFFARFGGVAFAGPGYRVVQKQPAGFQRAMRRLEIGRVIVNTDMLQHADGGDLVIDAFDRRIIAAFDAHFVLQA